MKKVFPLAALCVAPLDSMADTATVFGIEQYLSIDGVSEISVSPDGLYVAYTVTASDIEKDEYRYSVWVQPVAGGEPLRMTSADSSASAPAWSPDGRFLAVLSDRKDETSQVFLLDRRGGDAQQLTSLKQGVDGFAWAPDSQRLLLLAEDPTPADLDEEEKPNPRPYLVDRLQFKQDYVGYLDRHRSHLHVIELADREIRQVTFGDFDDSEPAWAPDSRRIVFVSNRTDFPDRNRNSDLFIVDTSDEEPKPRRLTTGETADASPSWSPDGKSIAYTSTVPGVQPVYAIPQLTVIDVDSGTHRIIEALAEIQVFTPRFTPDSSAVLAITEARAEQNLVRVDMTSDAVVALVEGISIVNEFDIAPDGTTFALISQPQAPNQVFVLGDGTPRRVTTAAAAELDGVAMATVEKYSHKSRDGTPLETLVTFPAGYDRKKPMPAVLYLHGGPQSQFNFGFDYEAQLLAARGFVVVMPNPRGSYGYGQAFAAAIYQDWGGIDYEDVMDAVDFAIESGWADPDRMAVYGWSYGGMLTNHVITKTDRFKAAITGASATLYVTNYGHDQYQRWWEEELGLPWLAENRDNWDRISPFFALDRVTTPTLIVGGEDDWNVPIINSEQLFIALKRQGVPTQLVVYPNEGHTLSVPSYEKDLYERYFDWLDRYVLGRKNEQD